MNMEHDTISMMMAPNPNDVFFNPIAQQGTAMLLNPVMAKTQQTGQRWFHALKYYFAVDNTYVWRKLKILFFPWTNKDWNRQRDQTMEYLPPTHDLNAPDLYLPVMGFVTYILLIGLAMGTSGGFTPDVIGITASSAMFTVFVEVLLVKLILWLTNFETLPLLDMIAYSGYKFVNSIVIISLGLVAGNPGFWASYLFTSVMLALFLVRSLRESLHIPSSTHAGTTRRNYFLVIWALWQIILTYFLCSLEFQTNMADKLSPVLDFVFASASQPNSDA